MNTEQERKLDSFVSKEVHCLCNEMIEQLGKLDDYMEEVINISACYPEYGRNGKTITRCENDACHLETGHGVACDFDYHYCSRCFSEHADPDPIEALQFFIVTGWLADRLLEKGEMVSKDLAGLTVWGRTTCGQAISMDSVIQEIYKEMVA